MCSPMPSSTPLFCHHVHERITGSTKASSASSLRWIHWIAVPAASTVAAAIDKMPSSEPFIGIRLPIRMIKAKAIPGITGISQAFSRNHPAAIIRRISRS